MSNRRLRLRRVERKRHPRFAKDFAGARNLQRGFTLLELLISMGIAASLLVAISAAFNASFSAMKFNHANFRCTQTARDVLDQITAEIRRADAVKLDASNTIVQVIRPTEQRTPSEIYRQYAYDAVNRRITLQIFYTGQGCGPVCELAPNISACEFGPAQTEPNTASSAVIVRMPIAITCSIEGSSVMLRSAASPRRARRF